MRVLVKNQLSNIRNTDIRWYLADEKLWITAHENYLDIEKTIKSSFGSFNWLYDVNDTVLFDRESGRFSTAIINLSGKINSLDSREISNMRFNQKEGDMFLVEKKIYDFEFPQKVYYFKRTDCLMSFSQNTDKYKDRVALYIANDFAFIIDNTQLKGWLLKNASNHIYVSDKHNNNITKKASDLLHDYFLALNIWEKNEENSEMLKKILQNVYLKNDVVSIAIKESIMNIL